MKKLLARLIVAFAALLTVNMSPARKAGVYGRVRDWLGLGIPVAISDGRKIAFCDNSRATSAQIRGLPKSEPDTIAWIEAMPEDGVLWDIGANIGFFSLYAGVVLGGGRECVVAFEPGASSYGVLNRNIEGNGMDDRIVAYCVALAGATRTGTLNMGAIGEGTEAGGWGNGFDSEIESLERNIGTVFRQGAVGFSIDDFVQMFGPPLPTHVKMDVDGIEADILRGGRRTLSAGTMCSMLIEMEGDLDSPRNRELFAVMAELGFAPLPKLAPELRNIIFERPGGV